MPGGPRLDCRAVTALRRPLAFALVVLCSLGLAACNWNGDSEPRSFAANEGVYVHIGDIAYQVQVSRQLNAASLEDREYFAGVPAAARVLPPREEWFAVWIRAQSQTSKPRALADDFRIVDTLGTVYRPITLPPENSLGYRAGILTGPGDSGQTYSGVGVSPAPDTPASRAGPVAGGVLIFRVSTDVYQNRPLILKIAGPPGARPASIVLDL